MFFQLFGCSFWEIYRDTRGVGATGTVNHDSGKASDRDKSERELSRDEKIWIVEIVGKWPKRRKKAPKRRKEGFEKSSTVFKKSGRENGSENLEN